MAEGGTGARPAERAIWHKLDEDDAELYRAHLHRLHARDRRSRFMGGVDGAVLDRHAAAIDWETTTLLACLIDGQVRGVGELYPEPHAPETAEAAFTVEREYQDGGIGSELARRICILARNRGIQRLYLVSLPDNARIRRIALKLGGKVRASDGDIVAELPLPPATTGTRTAEAADDAADRQSDCMAHELPQLRAAWLGSLAGSAPDRRG